MDRVWRTPADPSGQVGGTSPSPGQKIGENMARILVVVLLRLWTRRADGHAVVAGARSVAGLEVTLKRVPELVPAEVARPAGMKVDQPVPLVTVNELADYDAIVFGTPTRFGNMAAQMRNFLDQTGPCGLRERSSER